MKRRLIRLVCLRTKSPKNVPEGQAPRFKEPSSSLRSLSSSSRESPGKDGVKPKEQLTLVPRIRGLSGGRMGLPVARKTYLVKVLCTDS